MEQARGLDSPRAWLIVLATFLSSFVSLGIAYSFGAFFTDMAAEFGTAKGETAVVFGVTTFAFFWLSLITGRAVDVVGPRPVLAVGAVALLVGLLATSRVGSLTTGYLTYGAGVGLAGACGYIPMVATVGGWFERRRATAVGLAVAGIGAGTLVMSPLSAALIDRRGWRDTFVILGVAGAVVLALCVFLVDRPPGWSGPQPARFGDAIRSSVFRRLYGAALLSGLALFVPFIFVGQYARERGVGSIAAAVLVGVLGGASVLARIGFGTLVARFGSVPLFRLGFALLSVGYLVWAVSGASYPMLLMVVLVMGIGYGGFVALSTIVLAERFGVVGLGSIMGVFYTSQGIGGLIGPPTAGWLIDRSGYGIVIGLGFALAAAGGLLLIGVPTTDDGAMAPEPMPEPIDGAIS